MLRPVGGMTACAYDRHISISRIDDLVPDGVRLMRLIVVAGSTQFDLGRLHGQKQVVRRVRSMTGRAESVLHRHVFRICPLLPLNGVCVTLAAECDHGVLQERLLL